MRPIPSRGSPTTRPDRSRESLCCAVRVSVDRSSEKGLYILTGSVVKDDSATKHSGTGRISRLEMTTMSLFESKESTGDISLAELFCHPDANVDGARSKLSIEELLLPPVAGAGRLRSMPAAMTRNFL